MSKQNRGADILLRCLALSKPASMPFAQCNNARSLCVNPRTRGQEFMKFRFVRCMTSHTKEIQKAAAAIEPVVGSSSSKVSIRRLAMHEMPQFIGSLLAINTPNMPALSRKSLNSSKLATIRKQPFILFGLPFISALVIGSFALSSLTNTRYELRDTQMHTVSKEEGMKMKADRKKVDLREEYFRLSKDGDGSKSWENKRINRLPGQKEWGEYTPSAMKE